MPEGHTIHRIARDHRRWLCGDTVRCESPQGRFRDGVSRLDGQVLERVVAHGKHLFYRFADIGVLHVHLGLYGRFHTQDLPLPPPRGQVRLRLLGHRQGFDLNGPSTCEILDPSGAEKIHQRLGEDPLHRRANPLAVWQRISNSRASVGRLLLDQSVIAGVGNIFRCEVLYAAAVHPDREGRCLDRAEFNQMWQLLVNWMAIGVKYNRIITVEPSQATQTLGRLPREERLRIYKKSECLQCGAAIRQWNLANRRVYACVACQS